MNPNCSLTDFPLTGRPEHIRRNGARFCLMILYARKIIGTNSVRTPAFISVDTARDGKMYGAKGVTGTVSESRIRAFASAFPNIPRNENAAQRHAKITDMKRTKAAPLTCMNSDQKITAHMPPITAPGYHAARMTVRVFKSCHAAKMKVSRTTAADIDMGREIICMLLNLGIEITCTYF